MQQHLECTPSLNCHHTQPLISSTPLSTLTYNSSLTKKFSYDEERLDDVTLSVEGGNGIDRKYACNNYVAKFRSVFLSDLLDDATFSVQGDNGIDRRYTCNNYVVKFRSVFLSDLLDDATFSV